MSAALGVFHVTTYADMTPEPAADRVKIVAGVCAATKTDAAAGVIVHSIERLTYSPHGWPAGGVLVYTADDRLPA